MKLLLIGQSVEDHIYYKDEHKIKPGGIFYSVYALQNIADKGDEVYLCTSYRKDDHLFSELYGMINQEYLNYTDVIPAVRLNIYDDREREEIYQNITGSLNINPGNLERFDGILINMVTGFDISLRQMQEIRKNFKGPIYFDVHTFSRGVNEKMRREFRVIPDFSRWLVNIDILQVNSKELFTITESDDRDEVIKYVLDNGVKYILETRGKEGAFCYSYRNSEISVVKMYADEVNVRNQVGLGDVFGAVFFYSYIKNKSVNIALKNAVNASGMAASYDDFSDFKNLRNYVF
jgi:sugar/nucleoside kinase (ribokinase family)